MKIVVKPMPTLVQEYYKDDTFCYQYLCEKSFNGNEIPDSLLSHWHRPISGIVYIIQFLAGEYKGLCKIGFTAKWDERQKTLRRKYGDFILVHTITSNNARVAESWLHWRYEEYALGSEIFWIPSFLFSKIRKVTEIIAKPRTNEEFVKWRRSFYRTLVDKKYNGFTPLQTTHESPGYSDALEYYGVSGLDDN